MAVSIIESMFTHECVSTEQERGEREESSQYITCPSHYSHRRQSTTTMHTH